MFEELQEMIIPVSLKDATLPNVDEVTFWGLYSKRVFAIDYELEDDYRCIELAKIIYKLNVEEKDIEEKDLQPITLLLFSYGGSLDQAQALCDIIETSRIPIITVCMGVAMSAGFLIFLAGKRRYAMPQSTFLAHQGGASFSGSASEIEAAQNSYKKQLEQMKNYILNHTQISEKLFSKNKTKDWYITGKEDIESLGIAKVIKSFDEIV